MKVKDMMLEQAHNYSKDDGAAVIVTMDIFIFC